MLRNLKQTLIHHFQIFGIRECVEICLFALLFYKIISFLRTDRQSNLAGVFLGYWMLTFFTFTMGLMNVSTFLLWCSPLFLMLLITFHQQALQRAFVTFKKEHTSLQFPDQSTFVHSLIGSIIFAYARKKSILIMIEQQDALEPLIDAPFVLNAPIQANLLQTLIESPSLESSKIIWLTSQGIIKGFNATFKEPTHEHLVNPSIDTQDAWLADAILHSSKTDALIIHCNAFDELSTIIYKTKVVEKIQPLMLLSILNAHLNLSSTPQKRSKKEYEAFSQRATEHQLNH